MHTETQNVHIFYLSEKGSCALQFKNYFEELLYCHRVASVISIVKPIVEISLP